MICDSDQNTEISVIVSSMYYTLIHITTEIKRVDTIVNVLRKTYVKFEFSEFKNINYIRLIKFLYSAK